MKSDKHIVRSYRPYGIKAILISGPKFNELQHVEIKNEIPGDNSEPEFFKERRNYIHGRG